MAQDGWPPKAEHSQDKVDVEEGSCDSEKIPSVSLLLILLLDVFAFVVVLVLSLVVVGGCVGLAFVVVEVVVLVICVFVC